ncbi:MAG: SRPBCC domain-containing protein [Planctomycetes bacterium]|nr:SRPBCC domain-containing protein [Planctomycetota bacterium]MBI3832907.1 SRPBCC domain-containing protein [Planctomycetota bacterium]
MTRAQQDTDTIELKIEIAAPPEIVFKYFSDPQRYRAWMGDASTIDPKRGGTLTVAFGGGPTAKGEILEWISNEYIVFSWGHGGADASQVAITLERHERGTLVVLRHSGIRSEAERQGTAGGWRYYLSQLSSVTWSEKLKGRLDNLVDTYMQAWNEDDDARRTKLLSECVADAAWLSDKYIRVCGSGMINAHISTVRPMMQGVRLERNGPIQQCHGFAQFGWKAVMPDGKTFATGIDFCEFDEDGRIRNLVGFWRE